MNPDTRLPAFFQALTCVLLVLVGVLACTGDTSPPSAATAGETRIISLSPAFSETLVAWGMLDQLVGVDQFSRAPRELQLAREAGKVRLAGDAMNPDYEAILALRPSLIVAEATSFAHRYEKLKSFGLRLRTLPMESLDNLLNSYRELGAMVGHEAEAVRDLAAIEAILGDGRGRRRLKILLTYTSPDGGDVQCIGPKGYQSQMAKRLGAENVLTRELSFLTLSQEQLLGLDPDLIVQLSFEAAGDGLKQAWSGLDSLRAVREGQLFEFAFAEAQQQGLPSLLKLAEAMRKVLDEVGVAVK